MRRIDRFPEVLEEARAGAEDAWSELYDSVAAQLLGYLRGRGAKDPEDLLGETFLHLSRNLASFSGDESRFRSWAFTVAHHRLIDERRQRSRRPDFDDAAELESLSDQTDVAAEAIEAADHTIEKMLAALSDDQQEVVLLRVLGGLSAAETAALIGKTEGAVRVIQHRALGALRDSISAQDVTE